MKGWKIAAISISAGLVSFAAWKLYNRKSTVLTPTVETDQSTLAPATDAIPTITNVASLPKFMQVLRSYVPDRDKISYDVYDTILLDVYNNYLRRMDWAELTKKYYQSINQDNLFWIAASFEIWYNVRKLGKTIKDMQNQFTGFNVDIYPDDTVKLERKK